MIPPPPPPPDQDPAEQEYIDSLNVAKPKFFKTGRKELVVGFLAVVVVGTAIGLGTCFLGEHKMLIGFLGCIVILLITLLSRLVGMLLVSWYEDQKKNQETQADRDWADEEGFHKRTYTYRDLLGLWLLRIMGDRK